MLHFEVKHRLSLHVNLTKYAMGMTPFVLDNLFKIVQEFMDLMMSIDLFDLYNLVVILVLSIKILCGSCKHLEMSIVGPCVAILCSSMK